ncbi:cytochrome P450 [Parasediminibacterium paludis]|uniref:Cytochrome P450 n=1 Tax=Parasediminibacterium paludis TaxID=908966 RepID=A0ABV8Q1M3_9BACT
MLKNPLKAIYQMVESYGDIFAFKIGNMRSIIFLNHPDYVKHVLKDNVDNYSRGKALKMSTTGLEEMLGNGIFMSEGNDWEFQHKLLKNLFSPTAIESTLPILHDEIDQFITKWSNVIANSPIVNIEYDIHLLMLRIMLRSHVCNNYPFNYKEVFDTYNARIEASSWNVGAVSEAKSFFLKPLGINYTYKKHQLQIDKLNSFSDKLVQELLNGEFEPIGLFALMLSEFKEGRVTEKDIRDQLFNFLLAGFETTATAISWLLYNIVAQPNLQALLKNELKVAATSKDALLKQPSFLQLAIKESLRLYAPVWSTARVAVNDDVIGGKFIKAKSIVVVNSYALHRHKLFWPSGDRFDISNFEKDNFKGKTFAYIPYSQGKRICLGMALADYQIQTITSALLKAFHFETTSNKAPEIKANIIIKASPSLQLKISKASE